MEETNPRADRISELEKEIDEIAARIKPMSDIEKEHEAPYLKHIAKEYYVLTGQYHFPKGGW